MPKPAPQKTGVPASAIAAQIDELGLIERKLLPFRNDLAREILLRTAIRAHFTDSPAWETFEPAGVKFRCLVSARGNERVINTAKLCKLIGLKAFAAIAKTTLALLEKTQPPDIVANVVTSEQTGHRTLRTFERTT